MRILVINPGSTSTKVAVYDNEKQLWSENVYHSVEELSRKGTYYKDIACGWFQSAV